MPSLPLTAKYFSGGSWLTGGTSEDLWAIINAIHALSGGLLQDGSVSSPPLAFESDTDLGLYRIGDNRMGLAVGSSELGMEVGNTTISNLESPPVTVRYMSRLHTLPLDGAAETAGMYIRLDQSVDDQVVGIYGEVTDDQLDTYGALMKVVHFGAGDAIYVAMFSDSAVAFEAATWANGSKGFISTFQADSLPNSTLYTALHEWDFVPNYGLFYASEAYARALTIQKRTTSPDGNDQIRIVENDFSRNRFSVYNNGVTRLESLPATSGTTTRDAPELQLRGAYWDGGGSVDRNMLLQHVVSGAAASELRIRIGNTGTEAISVILRPTQLDMQENDIVAVNSVQGPAADTLELHTNATLCAEIDSTIADGETAFLIRRRVGETYSLQRVSMGVADSGGSGYKVLRVPN